MLSTFLSYVTVAVLILLLIFILPCIVRILRQSIQRLATELHLVVLRNKKGGDAGSRQTERKPEVPASTPDEALFHCTDPLESREAPT